MTKDEIIESGILELFVTGSLPQKEVLEVAGYLKKYPDLIKEVQIIEKGFIELAENVSPEIKESTSTNIRERISNVRSIHSGQQKTINWTAYTGWAAAVLCMLGIFWMLKETNELKENLRVTNTKNVILKEQVLTSEVKLAESTEILNAIRSDDYTPVRLPGNPAVSAEAFAKVFYNETEQVAYIDASGLPEPPKGKVYQVWSLIMEPLTPTDAGLLAAFDISENKIFKIEGLPNTEGFGITLEPEGGSNTPNLNQLYVLGTVAP